MRSHNNFAIFTLEDGRVAIEVLGSELADEFEDYLGSVSDEFSVEFISDGQRFYPRWISSLEEVRKIIDVFCKS